MKTGKVKNLWYWKSDKNIFLQIEYDNNFSKVIKTTKEKIKSLEKRYDIKAVEVL